MSTSSFASSGRKRPTSTPLVTSCTAAPIWATSTPNLPASARSTVSWYSTPGRGRESSISIMSSRDSSQLRISVAVRSSSAESSPSNATCTSLPPGGPCSRDWISKRMAGTAASWARTVSSVSRALNSPSDVVLRSRRIWPIVSRGMPPTPSKLKPDEDKPVRVEIAVMPRMSEIASSAALTYSAFSSADRAPCACTKTKACSGSISRKNSVLCCSDPNHKKMANTEANTAPVVRSGCLRVTLTSFT